MKKVILASVLATVALTSVVDANAATSGVVCAAPTAAGNGTIVVDTNATNEMVVNQFQPKCSANVHMAYDQGKAYFRVGAVSSAGSRSFRGSSAGGSVTSEATCSGTSCNAALATSAVASTSNPTSG
jgi:opacity protein-like surface antigen